MNRKYLMLLLVGVFMPLFVFPQTVNLKTYYDYDKNYRGASTAMYMGKNIEELQKKFADRAKNKDASSYFEKKRITKLSKQNYWLIGKALDEWETEAGEVYFVICADSEYSDDFIVLLVVIEEDGESFEWAGVWASTDEILKYYGR